MTPANRDHALVRQYKAGGNLEVLGELYRPYIPLVFGVCMKYLKHRERAEDAVTEIFETLIHKLQKHEVENFKPWLHVLTRNHCLMILRSSEWKMQQKNISDVFVDLPSILHHDNGVNISELDLQSLKACIDQLKNEQHLCISLFYLEERSYKEISDETNFDLKKVKSYIQNGKRNLKTCIEKRRENT